MENKDIYKKLFRDLKRGFSELNFGNSLFFLKHISFEDQVDLGEKYDFYYQQAIERGVQTEKEALERLKEEGLYSEEQENELSKFKEELSLKLEEKKNLFLKREIDKINLEIKDVQQKIAKAEFNKVQVLGKTAESYASDRLNDYYVTKCLYKDRNLKELAFKEEEFDEIDVESLSLIIKKYNEIYEICSDSNIQKLVLEDFFSIFLTFAEEPIHFFGKPTCDLTYHQLKLMSYCRFFRNVLQQFPDMPPEIKSDPDKIIDYVTANKNAEKIEKPVEKEKLSAVSYVGASKEDLDYMGAAKDGAKTISLREEAMKSGGTLDMMQMINLFNKG